MELTGHAEGPLGHAMGGTDFQPGLGPFRQGMVLQA